MKLNIYRLHFPGPIHIADARSDYGNSEKLIHSDMFYAALLAAKAMVTENVPADLDCTLSSLFPYTKDDSGKIIYFFPKPLFPLDRYSNYDDIKKLKRIQWLDQNYFEEILNGTIKSPINDNTVQKSFLSNSKIDTEFSNAQVLPRVAVPRSNSENDGNTNIFYIEKTYFKEGSGLYFIAYGDTKQLDKALSLLQEEGIGTDRNVGFGHFEYQKDTLELNLPVQSDYRLSLSLFSTHQEADLKALTDGKQAVWDIIKRGGWLTKSGGLGIRKKSVYMFIEGSVFSKNINDIEIDGDIALNLCPDSTDGFIAPEHPVWRSGRAIFLPIKIADS
ncbi:MAG: type III-A CRISPR-associated RAMP protein Csm4 [Chitinophagales bacterium]|nr:type III-A CRISPR-associated RAMP protein Csm4 [Chitinophagales bacterium]